MFGKITESIQQIGRFSERDLAVFRDKLQLKSLPKEAWLLRQGQVCSSVYFVKTGSLRQYHLDDEHEETTLNLFVENDWAFDFESFMHQKPSKSAIIAFEETVVFELSVVAIHDLVAHSQAFLLLGKLLEIGSRDRQYDTLVSPEEEYRYLLTTKPQLLQKFPLKHIASFMRMTPETLSRVRNKLNKN